jgi:hypothetical protein
MRFLAFSLWQIERVLIADGDPVRIDGAALGRGVSSLLPTTNFVRAPLIRDLIPMEVAASESQTLRTEDVDPAASGKKF